MNLRKNRVIALIIAVMIAVLILVRDRFEKGRVTSDQAVTTVAKVHMSDTVQWMVVNWPPVMEVDSVTDRIIGGSHGIQVALLRKVMKGYRFRDVAMRLPRFWTLVAEGEPLIYSMSLWSEEREKVALFSLPHTIISPNMIALHRRSYEEMGRPASLSLETLLKDPNRRGLLIAKRSYGREIDSILALHEDSTTVERATIDEVLAARMLVEKRADYSIGYSFNYQTIIKNFKEDFGDSAVICVPIRETAPFYYVYATAPRTAWGEQIIRDLNRAIKECVPTKEYRDALKTLYSGGELERMNSYYDRYLIPIVRDHNAFDQSMTLPEAIR